MLSLVSCEGRSARASSNDAPALAAAAPRTTGATATRKKAPVTPAIAAASEKLLKEHGDSPIGAEHTLKVEGKRYVARIEEHENSSGDPSRPPGKHKGVTVYEP